MLPTIQGKQLNIERNQVKLNACAANLKLLGVSCLLYSQDWDGLFPPMKSPGVFQAATFPYSKNKLLYRCSSTNLPYHPSASLSGRPAQKIKNSARTVLIKCPAPHPGNLSVVCFANGRVKAMKSVR